MSRRHGVYRVLFPRRTCGIDIEVWCIGARSRWVRVAGKSDGRDCDGVGEHPGEGFHVSRQKTRSSASDALQFYGDILQVLLQVPHAGSSSSWTV